MSTVPASTLLDISRDHAGHQERRDKSWCWYADGERGGAFPFAVSSLYRGQTAHFAPLLPSIARGLQQPDIGPLWRSPPHDQAIVVLRLAQSWWFSRELERHPVATHAAEQGLTFNSLAIAQHYGIPTGYLDLTDDFDVSAFFATCRASGDAWEPVDTGVGVIYRVNLRATPDALVRYTPLGPQQLPRPTEQAAWVVELPLGPGLEGWPGVSMLQFEHDRRVSEHFLEKFDGGARLFPPDPLADVAHEILTCREIPGTFFDAALESFAADSHGLKRDHAPALRSAVANLVTLADDRSILRRADVARLLANSAWRERILAGVKATGLAVRRIPISLRSEAGEDAN